MPSLSDSPRLSLSDSPREVARKVIAAREVRKRQVKKKAPEPATGLDVRADRRRGVARRDIVGRRAAPRLRVVADETSDAVVEPVLDAPIVGDSIAEPADDVIAAPLLEAVDARRRQSATCRNAWWPSTSSGRAKRRTRRRSAPGRASPSGSAFDKPFDKPLEMQRPETERAVPDRSEWATTSKYDAPSILRRRSHRSPRLSTSRSPSRGCRRRTMNRRATNRGWRFCQSSSGCSSVLLSVTRPATIRGNREPPTVTATAPPRCRAARARRRDRLRRQSQWSAAAAVPANRQRRHRRCRQQPRRRRQAGGARATAIARPPRPVATTGRLVVTSTPAKAAVTINGKWTWTHAADGRRSEVRQVRRSRRASPATRSRGKQVTFSSSAAIAEPLTIDAAAGEGAGARSRARGAAAPAQAPAAASKPAASTTGEIFVDSRPRGARVFIDGKEVGVTPLRLTGQPVGSLRGAARAGRPPVLDGDGPSRRREDGARHRFARTHQIEYRRTADGQVHQQR